MNLAELEETPPEETEETFEEGQEEADLATAIELVNAFVAMTENIIIKPSEGRIIKVPRGMKELLEEAQTFLDQFELPNSM